MSQSVIFCLYCCILRDIVVFRIYGLLILQTLCTYIVHYTEHYDQDNVAMNAHMQGRTWLYVYRYHSSAMKQ